MSRFGVILTTTLVCAACGSLLWSRVRSEATGDGSPKNRTQALLRSEIAGLKDDLLQLRSLVDAIGQINRTRNDEASPCGAANCNNENVDNSPAETRASPPDVETQAELDRQHEDERVQKRTSLIETTVMNEQPDPEWAPVAVRQLDSSYNIPEISIAKYSTKCGQTLCRVEFALSKGADVRDGLNALMSHSPWGGQVLLNVRGDGTGVSYYAREGFDLPETEERGLN
jgi:hypothetical protein